MIKTFYYYRAVLLFMTTLLLTNLASANYSLISRNSVSDLHSTASSLLLPIPPSDPIAINSTQCGAQVPTALVVSTSGVPSPTFRWYDAPVGGIIHQESTSNTFGIPVITTFTFYVCEVDLINNLESNRVPVTITVNNPTTATVAVTACGSYTWPLNNTPYTASGSHTVTLPGANSVGCDSTVTLNLTINQPTSSTFTASACSSYTWAENNVVYTATGLYPIVVGLNDAGCDSTVILDLTINQTSSTFTASACSSYTWAENNATYTASGLYPIVVGLNDAGCDSTVILDLTINQTSSTFTAAACGPYTWAENNVVYTVSGLYPIVVGPNDAGCDSTVILDLTINQPTTATVAVTECGSYTWPLNNATYTASGSHTVTLPGANSVGCDSTVTLNLTINQPTSSIVTATACGSYTWAENNATYTASGSHTVTLAGANSVGCDSTITLNLTINQPTSSTFTASACSSYTWAENNVVYTASGLYPIVVGPNDAGCDSTVILDLTINQTSSTFTASACSSYTWAENNVVYTASGLYPIVVGLNDAGCDSTVILDLTINQTSSTFTAAACGPYTWAENNVVYTASGLYPIVVGPNDAGCDSTVILDLTINQPTSSTVTVSACTSYTWAEDNATYTASGSYPVVLAGANANGCDSTVTLILTINQPTTATVAVTECGSYTWPLNNTTYTASGSHTVTLAGANSVGCDSTVTLNLTINQPTTATVAVTECGSYTWPLNNTTYTASGSHTVTLAGANSVGCDSTITLNLTINQPTSSSVSVTACGSYTWAENNATYTASGSHTVTLAGANSVGCDSTVTLNLTINQPTTATVAVTECGSYTWPLNNTTYTASGSHTVTLAGANSVGCDSTVTLNLTINQPTTATVAVTECGSYTWPLNNTTYTASGSHVVTLAGANANGCDSTVTLVLTITGLPTATATDNGNATITASAGASYQWINCATNTAIAGATTQTYTVTANGNYAVVVTNAGGCSDTSSCVTIDYIGLTEITDASIQVFPNPTNNDVTITMTAAEATVEVADAQGKILQAVTVGNGEKVTLSTYETGVYFLRIRTANGSTLERVVKQ